MTMIDTTLLMTALLIGWFIPEFEPIFWIGKRIPIVKRYMYLLECNKCCSFWAALTLGTYWVGTLDSDQFLTTMRTAILAAFIAYLYNKTIAKLLTLIPTRI